MNILLLGANGYLGKFIKNYLDERDCNVIAPAKTEVDLRIPGELTRYSKNSCQFDRVINCAVFQRTGDALIAQSEEVFLQNSQINSNIIDFLISSNYPIIFDTVGASCAYSNKTGSLDYFDGSIDLSVQAFANPKRQLAIALQHLSKEKGHTCRVFVPGTLVGPGEQLDLAKKHFVNAIILRAARSISENSPLEKFGNMQAIREVSLVENVAKFIIDYNTGGFCVKKILPDFRIKVGQIYDFLEDTFPMLLTRAAATNFNAKIDKTISEEVVLDLTSQKIQNSEELSNIITNSFSYYSEKLSKQY